MKSDAELMQDILVSERRLAEQYKEQYESIRIVVNRVAQTVYQRAQTEGIEIKQGESVADLLQTLVAHLDKRATDLAQRLDEAQNLLKEIADETGAQ